MSNQPTTTATSIAPTTKTPSAQAIPILQEKQPIMEIEINSVSSKRSAPKKVPISELDEFDIHISKSGKNSENRKELEL